MIVTIAALLAVICSCTVVNAERGFILTSPRNLAQHEKNPLHLHLFDVYSGGTVQIRLLKGDNDTVLAEQEFPVPAGIPEITLQFEVPEITDYEAKLQIKGTFDTDDQYEIFGEDTVNFMNRHNSIITFIQTDKPIYKPGQQVKFRVLPLDRSLKPLGNNVQGDIWVEDPSSSRVMQWKNVTLASGIRQFEFPLSEEPNLGNWKILTSVNDMQHQTTIEVKEYVLPKYELVIKPPSFVLVTAESMEIEVCGMYTYGKEVEGHLKINSTLETYSWSSEKHPFVLKEEEIEGCYKYDVNISLIDQDLQNTYRRIKIFAEIEEKGTGVIRNKTIYVDRTQTPLQLRFETDSRQYFKPGLPYHGKLKVSHPDNAPAAEEPVRVCVLVSRERVLSEWWATRKVKYCRNYTSDEEGAIQFTFPPQNTDVVSMSIEAASLKYGTSNDPGKPTLYQPQSSAYLRPWYSPSGSHIQIQVLGGKLPCDKPGQVQVLFTSKESGQYKFVTEVIHNGRVAHEETIEVDFDAKTDSVPLTCEDDVTLDANEIQLVPPPTAEKSTEEVTKDVEENQNCKAMKEARYVPHVGSFNVSVDVSADISPAFHFLVYYVREDRETVADSQKFTVEKCFKNKVGLEFADESQQPAGKTTLTLTSAPNSLCGIKVVDKSISLLDSSNQLTKDRVFDKLENSYSYYSRNHCNDQKAQPGLPRAETSSSRYFIRPPKPWSSSSYEDAITAFENAGFLVISDFVLITRPCKPSGPSYENYGGVALPSMGVRGSAFAMSTPARRPAAHPVAAAEMDLAPQQGAGAGGLKRKETVTKSAVDVRTYFPETWLFEFQSVGEEGTVSLKETLPHTITEWLGTAVCINSEQGLGLSDTASIKGFQAFFLSFTLPYSVIRGEKVPVIVTVFNYIDKCLPISLEFRDTGGYMLLSESSTRSLCLCGGKSESTEFVIQATTLGKLNLTVAAQNADVNLCGDNEVAEVVAKDAITNKLLVEAEGFPMTKVTNVLFCPKDEEGGVSKHEISFVLPEDVVEDSARAYISLSGDIMGSTIQNLDHLVRLPTGCGEQNIVTFTPNVLVLDYLTATNKLTDKIKERALTYLRKGYQREMKYARPDGSFSAFGPVDEEGSLFLTAFVMKSFAQAQAYIDIDQSVLNKSRDWILSKQRDDGCFPEVGKTFNQGMKGGLNSSMSAMTAYVASTLLLSGDVKDAEFIKSALSCVEKEKDDLQPFNAALFAYTEVLAGKKEEAQKYLDVAFEKAETADGETNWYKKGASTPSVSLETASYAVLTLLMLDESKEKSLPIIRSMVKMRNDYGGFYSTQDTVLGLEALSKFSALLGKDPVDITVDISGSLEEKVTFNEDDKILVKKVKVPTVPSEVHVEATGSGCGVMQTILLLNTKNPVKQQYFTLDIETRREAEQDCSSAAINVCTSYVPEGKRSGMALVEVKMLSGMVPRKETLEKLKGDRNVELKRYEVENNNIVFYFDELTNEKKCFEFVVEEVVKVLDRKEAITKVYDYYAPEQSEEKGYTIPESCE